jgi:hypothetical protein
MPEIVVAAIGAVEIVAPTAEAADLARREWEQSALDWLDRASEHELAGRDEEAASARTVASIAAAVACGRAL